jgi:hypothetical protein
MMKTELTVSDEETRRFLSVGVLYLDTTHPRTVVGLSTKLVGLIPTPRSSLIPQISKIPLSPTINEANHVTGDNPILSFHLSTHQACICM